MPSLRKIGLLLGTLAAFGLLPTATLHADTTRARYTLAVVPYELPLAARKDWMPIVQHLSKRLDADIELRVYRTFTAFEGELFQGTPDFAFINPYHQLIAYRRHGYLPLVRSGQPLRGILVVPKDSPVTSLKDLDGKTIAFPSPNAFASSLYMRALLAEREHLRFNPRYLDSHNEVYRHVMLDEAQAGGSTAVTLAHERPELQSQLRVLYVTPPTVSHPLTVHPRVPAAVRAAMTQAILELDTQAEGKNKLARAQLSAPLIADQQRDYQPLEQLHLERYVVITQ